ncbi:MAG: hypothetical protein HEQ39_16685 [Rhizobacter sp.]
MPILKTAAARILGALVLPLIGINAHAAPPNVTIIVNAFGPENVIRDDITRSTFGSGVEHQNPQFRDVVGPSPSTSTYKAIKGMNLGTMRFPMGTSGLHYFWDRPEESYISHPGVSRSLVITPDEMYKFTASEKLNMERLFEVNTAQYLAPNFQLHHVIQTGSSPARINPASLTLAAQSAAAWVADTRTKPGASVGYWEIGNEDWVYWTPAEYATIFNAFAAEMKAKDPGAKLLSQSLTTTHKVPGKPDNNHLWLQGLIDGGINRQHVYALSEHEYLSGGTFTTGTVNDQRNWQTQNMFAQVANAWNVPYLKRTLQEHGLDWKIWMTEFNVFQTNADSSPAELQDLGHALIVADWTGKMLEQGVDRIFMHSLDHNPYFALVNYVNSGGTIAAPRVTVPGYAFSKYAQSFGKKMVSNTILGNATLSSPSNGEYPQIAAYTSVMESDPTYAGYPSTRIMVINRSTTDSAQITIKTLNRPIAGREKTYSVQTLTSTNIPDSNKQAADVVTWSNPVVARSNSAGITRNIPKSSASFFVIPLQ